MRLMIVGSAGLVGQGVLLACRAAPDMERIVLPLRRGGGPSHDPRVHVWPVTDLHEVDGTEPAFADLDACVHCAGVVPGLSESAYRAVTVELTLHVAHAFGRANPRGTFVYISGAHSDARSLLMPLRVKGEAEDALRATGLRTIMVRPGVVQPVDGVHSPHRMRDAVYALINPLMAAGVRGAPALVTTSTRIGVAVLDALRRADPPAVLENADINAIA